MTAIFAANFLCDRQFFAQHFTSKPQEFMHLSEDDDDPIVPTNFAPKFSPIA